MSDLDKRVKLAVEKILDLKVARPELIDLLYKATRLETDRRKPWTVLDIGVPPSKIHDLMKFDLIEKVDTVRYRVKDLEAVREALSKLGYKTKKVIGKGPAFNVTMDIFKGIVGYENVKRYILMALRARRPTHVLLIGPPGVGKTVLLDTVRESLESMGECVGHVEGGKGLSTSVGLVEVVLQFPPDTPCLLTIDELDKMDREDMAALYRLMANVPGEVVLAKHKRIVREKRWVWVLAAANYEHRIPEQIRSRFLRIRFKPLTPEQYVRIVPKILEVREGVEPELAKYIAVRLSRYTTDPRDAIKIARMAWSKEDVDFLVESIFEKRRQSVLG